MEIVGTNMEEEQKKSKKLMTMIIIAIVLLLIISVILGFAIYYLKSKQFKFVIDGQTVGSYSSDLFVFKDDEIYVSLKDISPLVGYEYKKGGYKQYTEDENKCYLECEHEVVTLDRDSDKIYKTVPDELDYTYFTISEPIRRVEGKGKLYINSKDLGLVCNLQIEYDEDLNKISIATLSYIADYYTKAYTNSSVTENFNNQKALLYNLMVIQNVDNTDKNANQRDILYGVYDLKEKKEAIGEKYTAIEFIEGNQEFMVTTPEEKVGIISKTGATIIKPIYDELKLIDKDRKIYLAMNNNLYGIVYENGYLLHLEFDQIGVDVSQFQTNDIKNRYILFDNAIPVKRNNKWGLYDIDGKEILPLEYDSMGCVARTSSDKSLNNILIIPPIEGIVVGKEYETGTSSNSKTMYYGVVSSTGRELIPTWMERIYSVITSGQEKYTMVNMGNEIDIIDYIREQGILESEDIDDEENDTNTNTIDNSNNLYTNETVDSGYIQADATDLYTDQTQTQTQTQTQDMVLDGGMQDNIGEQTQEIVP